MFLLLPLLILLVLLLGAGWRSGESVRPPTDVFPVRFGIICGLSLMLVLYSSPRGFPPGLWFLPLLKNQHFQIPIWNVRPLLNEFFELPWSSVGKQIYIYIYILPLLLLLLLLLVSLCS